MQNLAIFFGPLFALFVCLVLFRIWALLGVKIEQERIRLAAMKEESSKNGVSND
jgi:hypothetical protein